MGLKTIYKVDGVEAFTGLRDYFKHPAYLVVNHDLGELRLYGKNDEYKKRRKFLDKRKLTHVFTPEYLEVIDISKETANFLAVEFGDYKHTDFQIWE